MASRDSQAHTTALASFAHEVRGPAGAPWVTFVPGIGNDRHFWAAQAGALSGSYRVLSFDPWGHGDSPAPPPQCGFEDILHGLASLWDHLRLPTSSVVGLGFGGSLALAMGIAYPTRIERIVACSCRARQPQDRRNFWSDRVTKANELGMAALADITVDRWLSEAFRKEHPDIDLQLRQAMRRTTLAGYETYVRAFVKMDFTEQLGQIRAPVQLIAGELDHGGGPPASMQEMAGCIPGAGLVVIPGVGHLCALEAPHRVTEIIRGVLDM